MTNFFIYLSGIDCSSIVWTTTIVSSIVMIISIITMKH